MANFRNCPGHLISPVKISALVLILLGISVAACQKNNNNYEDQSTAVSSSTSVENEQIYNLSGPTMGTSYNIKLVLPAFREKELDDISKKVKQTLNLVEEKMSTYKSDSELSRFNSSPPGVWYSVSPQLFKVISASQTLSESSHGAFDVTVGPLVNLWGFGPDYTTEKVPTDNALMKAFEKIGFQKLSLKPESKKVKKSADLFLDLSAIAKGYGVDEVVHSLKAMGVNSALVEVGGEISAYGAKPEGKHWRIAIESPVTHTRAIQRIINIEDTAMATSGDYRNYFEIEGRRYSHTINPNTGKPITHKLASATVFHKSCMLADGMATMFMVMGAKESIEYANKHRIAVYLLIKSDNGFSEQMSDVFIHRFGVH